jgi:hypothetical protein
VDRFLSLVYVIFLAVSLGYMNQRDILRKDPENRGNQGFGGFWGYKALLLIAP